jgi:hypothetical protein
MNKTIRRSAFVLGQLMICVAVGVTNPVAGMLAFGTLFAGLGFGYLCGYNDTKFV